MRQVLSSRFEVSTVAVGDGIEGVQETKVLNRSSGWTMRVDTTMQINDVESSS